MNFFSPINRNALVRKQAEKLDLKAKHSQSQFILFAEDKFFFNQQNFYFSLAEINALKHEFSEPIYLGENNEVSYFALTVNPDNVFASNAFSEFEQFSIRQIKNPQDQFELSLLFYTQGLIKWHATHQFCARCGSTNHIINAGHSRRCSNRNCLAEHFPKIDPAVIFSIVNNHLAESKILLARQAHWDKNRFSVIAGFVETGESLEDAVKRETAEEVGLSVEQISYFASQPWPFPNSLMLGFTCITSDEKINLVDEELEEAAWFTANQLERKIKAGKLLLPSITSIAWRLIDHWFIQQKNYSIKKLI